MATAKKTTPAKAEETKTTEQKAKEYKALVKFADKTDKDFIYEVGDVYPRKGLKLDEKRVEYLSGEKNTLGVKIIG